MTAALLLLLMCAAANASDRLVESVLPSLDYSAACSSSVTLQNLGDRAITVVVEAHTSGGGLVPLTGHPAMSVRLDAGERESYKLRIEGAAAGAWVKVQETASTPAASAVVAVSGATDCVVGNRVLTAAREVAYPTRNPWFSGDVADLRGGVVSLINTSDRAASASGCYSSGVFYSAPNPSTELTPVCSSAVDVQIPPFGSRLFPAEHEGNSHFSLKTAGDAIVLQMLRPVVANVRMYRVDSTIQFGSEIPGGK
ncbi:MAG: hypothetical protein ACRD9L_08465 [Bryobacteraceae bacterium]